MTRSNHFYRGVSHVKSISTQFKKIFVLALVLKYFYNCHLMITDTLLH